MTIGTFKNEWILGFMSEVAFYLEVALNKATDVIRDKVETRDLLPPCTCAEKARPRSPGHWSSA